MREPGIQSRQPVTSAKQLHAQHSRIQRTAQTAYAALRAWRRELRQTFFSTVWKPSLSFGGSS